MTARRGVAPGVKVSHGARFHWGEAFTFTARQVDALSVEIRAALAKVSSAPDLCAVTVEQLRSTVESWRQWESALASSETPSQARDHLQAVAAKAAELAELLASTDTRAGSHYRDAALSFGLASLHDLHPAVQALSIAAKAAADAVVVEKGRDPPRNSRTVFVQQIADALAPCKMQLKQGGPFLRICDIIFAAAGVPASPRDAIRALQKEREQTPKT